MAAVTGPGGPAVLVSGFGADGRRKRGRSRNEKLGNVIATYVAMQSCPTSCQFHPANLHGAPKANPQSGMICYALRGNLVRNTYPLNAAGFGQSPLALAIEEAARIDAITNHGGLPMRLHDVGDSPTAQAAAIVATAAERFMARGGGPVWAYTHAWRTVPRVMWGAVSIIASCDAPEDIPAARDRGYATALVVPSFPLGPDGHRSRGKVYTLGSERLLPCPEQTGRASTCADCRLCMNAGRLHRDQLTITFQEH